MAHIKDEFRLANWVNIVIALWLVLAPFILWFTDLRLAMWNSIAVGVAMAVVSLFGAINPLKKPGLIWINFVLGLWLLLSPFLLGFNEAFPPTLSHVAMGMLVTALAAGAAVGARSADRGRR